MVKWTTKIVSESQETTTYNSVCGNYKIVSYDWNKYKNFTLYKTPNFQKALCESSSLSALKKYVNTLL